MKDKWTAVDVADRFEEAVQTMHRLPAVRVQGYFNSWPDIVHSIWEKMRTIEDKRSRLPPPPPDAISRMDETFRWLIWLEVKERKIVLSRAENIGWKQLEWRFGASRQTLWRHWSYAMIKISSRLNAR